MSYGDAMALAAAALGAIALVGGLGWRWYDGDPEAAIGVLVVFATCALFVGLCALIALPIWLLT
jgi:hypothetical protein